MDGVDTDRGVLMGILALQNGVLNRGALLAGFRDWVIDKTRPLGAVLVARGSMTGEVRDLLEALAATLLENKNDAAGPGLSVLSTIGPLRADLARIAEP